MPAPAAKDAGAARDRNTPEHHKDVAEQYLKNQQWLAAKNRLEVIVREHSSSEHVEQALARLVEVNLALGLTQEAQTSASVLGRFYPSSTWYTQAFAMLEARGLVPREDGSNWMAVALAAAQRTQVAEATPDIVRIQPQNRPRTLDELMPDDWQVLEERVAELEATTASKGNRRIHVEIEGLGTFQAQSYRPSSPNQLSLGSSNDTTIAAYNAPIRMTLVPAKPASPAAGASTASTEQRVAAAAVAREAKAKVESNSNLVRQSLDLQAGRKEKAEGQRLATVPAGAPAPVAVAPAVDGRQRTQAAPGMALVDRKHLGGQIAAIAPPAPTRDTIVQLPQVDHGRDQFQNVDTNPVRQVAAEPVSTFSIDVDTASYSFVRRSLNAGRLPPKDAVRVEEMINYFPYDYARPESTDAPFRASVQVFPSPWNASNQLVHIGLKGYDLKSAERPRANLVLLVDISGSMGPADRLPLLKNAFKMLLDNLAPEDTVGIVTYAAGSDIRLQPTKVAEKARIISAIDSLNASGSTHGAAGINDAYKVAEANFDKAAVNRVILATDGDWNVGITNREELKGFVERKRQTGIYLSILGVGMGNHNDALMQALAQNGNGAAAYIDTLSEARKVLVDEASSTLFPIAKDVKIQLEFNPGRVSEYRLIGYETRMLKREDFNNDKVDAGDVGSGHSVTAIYEITPVGAPKLADELRYQQQRAAQAAAKTTTTDDKQAELGFLKLRYKLPKEEASRLTEFVIGPEQTRRTTAEASTEARFSTAVAAFGQLLRGTPNVQGITYDQIIALANGAKGDDPFGYRAEFVNLVRLAKSAAASVGPR